MRCRSRGEIWMACQRGHAESAITALRLMPPANSWLAGRHANGNYLAHVRILKLRVIRPDLRKQRSSVWHSPLGGKFWNKCSAPSFQSTHPAAGIHHCVKLLLWYWGMARGLRAQQGGKRREQHQRDRPRQVKTVRLVTTAATVPACICGVCSTGLTV